MSNLVETLTGGVAGIAIGEAGAAALEPVFEPVRQDGWKKKPTKILDADQLATLVAQALNAVSDVADDAERNGFAADEFTSLVQLALKAPGPPDAEKLYLRAQGNYPGAITEALLHHAYGKAGLEPQYWPALTAAAQTTLLTPAQLALGAVRGTVNDQGLLVIELDTSDSNVKQYTPAALNIVDEAAASGVSAERLRAMIGSIGLPMGAIEAARAEFRQIITKGAYYQAILEGDTRPEWADSIYEAARQIPTAHDAIEMRLRNYFTTDQQMYDSTARHGMSQADTDLLFKVTGRPLSFHETFIGTIRGGVLGGPIDAIEPAFLDSLRKSNIRPEYYPIAWAQRYVYPSAFVTRSLAQAGELDYADTLQILTYEGWEPTLAAKVAATWTGSQGATPKTLTRAEIKAALKADKLTDAQALARLSAEGLSAEDARLLLDTWGSAAA